MRTEWDPDQVSAVEPKEPCFHIGHSKVDCHEAGLPFARWCSGCKQNWWNVREAINNE